MEDDKKKTLALKKSKLRDLTLVALDRVVGGSGDGDDGDDGDDGVGLAFASGNDPCGASECGFSGSWNTTYATCGGSSYDGSVNASHNSGNSSPSGGAGGVSSNRGA